jgi:hypothetical protein
VSKPLFQKNAKKPKNGARISNSCEFFESQRAREEAPKASIPNVSIKPLLFCLSEKYPPTTWPKIAKHASKM